MNHILVIRGGAIGDFILTLPAIKLLRNVWPNARLEILGYKHIIALAENRGYADATRSIEYGPLASFFAKRADLPAELVEHFGNFDLVVSYLFDPDGIFEANLRRCGSARIIIGPAKLNAHEHAMLQLARPLAALGLTTDVAPPELFPSASDHAAAAALLPQDPRRLIAIHPGSGSASKNWPIERWLTFGERLLEAADAHLVVIGGEADESQIDQLRNAGPPARTAYVINQPLPIVAAVIARCGVFVGHDSGISHVAGAVGAKLNLLFGPTDPRVWAPQNANARILRAASGAMADVGVEDVLAAIATS